MCPARLPCVSWVRVGRSLRTLRQRAGLRQLDVAKHVGIAQSTVSAIERGRLAHLGLATLAKVAGSLDADLVVFVRWRGGELDRLLDDRHAALVARIAEIVERAGWPTKPELTFSEFGERGSIDLVAWHAATRTLLVIEVKTELTSVEETLRKHDLKVRLARSSFASGSAGSRFGWRGCSSSPTSRPRAAGSLGMRRCSLGPTRCGASRFGGGCGCRSFRQRVSRSCH